MVRGESILKLPSGIKSSKLDKRQTDQFTNQTDSIVLNTNQHDQFTIFFIVRPIATSFDQGQPWIREAAKGSNSLATLAGSGGQFTIFKNHIYINIKINNKNNYKFSNQSK